MPTSAWARLRSYCVRNNETVKKLFTQLRFIVYVSVATLVLLASRFDSHPSSKVHRRIGERLAHYFLDKSYLEAAPQAVNTRH